MKDSIFTCQLKNPIHFTQLYAIANRHYRETWSHLSSAKCSISLTKCLRNIKPTQNSKNLRRSTRNRLWNCVNDTLELDGGPKIELNMPVEEEGYRCVSLEPNSSDANDGDDEPSRCSLPSIWCFLFLNSELSFNPQWETGRKRPAYKHNSHRQWRPARSARQKKPRTEIHRRKPKRRGTPQDGMLLRRETDTWRKKMAIGNHWLLVLIMGGPVRSWRSCLINSLESGFLDSDQFRS